MNTEARVKSPIWIYEKTIPDEICDYIISSLKDNEYDKGRINSTNINEKVRNVLVQYIPQSNWISSLVHYYGFDANKSNFNYAIGDVSAAQFLKYEPGMFYRVHADTSYNPDNEGYYRKLTVIVNLTDPSDFEGGEFVLFNDGLTPIRLKAEKGTVFVFPSYLNHKISPIKEGIRYSIVGWIMGPPFS